MPESETGTWRSETKLIRAAGAVGPWDPVDWQMLFMPATSLLEIFLPGTLVYLALFVLLRVVLKRESGTLGMTDLLVVVLIADAAQNAMADDYRSIPEGILLVAVVVGWAWGIEALGYHVPAVERLLRPRPLPLVKDGTPIRENMRKELVTLEELRSQLREQGVEDWPRSRSREWSPTGASA
jgi:uncharacterized membrane protein YcaP (DUF421 family)